MQDWKGAIQDFDKAIQISPSYSAAWRNRGIVKETIGDLRGACMDWRSAAILGQQDASQWIAAQCN